MLVDDMTIPEAWIPIFLGNPSNFLAMSNKFLYLILFSINLFNFILFSILSVNVSFGDINFIIASVSVCDNSIILAISLTTCLAAKVSKVMIPATFFWPYLSIT